MLDFKGKVVVITGGTRGIGLATVRAFTECGAQVVLFGSREETVQKALAELNNAAEIINATETANATEMADGRLTVDGFWPDLLNFTDVEQVIQEIAKKYGRIDVLINNAGISANRPIEETTEEDFRGIIELNVTAMFHTIKAVVPIMKKQGGGVILNTSSMVSFYGQPSGVGYPTSKAAVNGLTRSLARELAPYKIRVNAVAPGIIETDMVANLPDEVIEPLIKTVPLGRMGEPREVANAFLFLASELASYVTGEILQVDGAVVV